MGTVLATVPRFQYEISEEIATKGASSMASIVYVRRATIMENVAAS